MGINKFKLVDIVNNYKTGLKLIEKRNYLFSEIGLGEGKRYKA